MLINVKKAIKKTKCYKNTKYYKITKKYYKMSKKDIKYYKKLVLDISLATVNNVLYYKI